MLLFKYVSQTSIIFRMLCAGYESENKGACRMDTGGPLVENATVVGIVTYRESCEVTGYFGIYTDVAAVRDWITQITGL